MLVVWAWEATELPCVFYIGLVVFLCWPVPGVCSMSMCVALSNCLVGSPSSRRCDRAGQYPRFSRVLSKEVQGSGVKGHTG